MVVCWTESALPGSSDSEVVSEANAQLVQTVNAFFNKKKTTEWPEIISVFGPSESKAAIDVAKEKEATLLVAISEDPTGARGGQLCYKPAAEAAQPGTAIPKCSCRCLQSIQPWQALGICSSLSKPQDKCVFRVEQGSSLITVARFTRPGEVNLSVSLPLFREKLLTELHDRGFFQTLDFQVHGKFEHFQVVRRQNADVIHRPAEVADFPHFDIAPLSGEVDSASSDLRVHRRSKVIILLFFQRGNDQNSSVG